MGNNEIKSAEVSNLLERRLDEEANMIIDQFRKRDKCVSNHDFLETKIEQITPQSCVDFSSFVYRGLQEEKNVVLKIFRHDTTVRNGNIEEFEEKVKKMLAIPSHPNLIQFFGCIIHPPRVAMFMEFSEYGNIKAMIDRCIIPLKIKLELLSEACSGLAHLHENNVIHRDVSCDNILLSEKLVTKVSNYGIAGIIKYDYTEQKTKVIADSVYIPPEAAYSDEGYVLQSDIYSFAIVAYICLSGNSKPYGEGFAFVERRIKNDESLRPNLEILSNALPTKKNIRTEITDMVKRSWSQKPEDRDLSFGQISEKLKKLADQLPEVKLKLAKFDDE